MPDSFNRQISHHLDHIFTVSSLAFSYCAVQADAIGTDVWNLAANLYREVQDASGLVDSLNGQVQALISLRALAFCLLDASAHAAAKDGKTRDQTVRILKVGLRTARFCLQTREVELALKVLEKCSAHVETIDQNRFRPQSEGEIEMSDYDHVFASLTSEFFLLRVMYAWKSGRMDLAEHFFSKLPAQLPSKTADLAEKATTLYHEIGSALRKTGAVEPALQWFERAIAALGRIDIEDMSYASEELRLAVSAEYGRHTYLS